jgi:signal transduction histidine kinase
LQNVLYYSRLEGKRYRPSLQLVLVEELLARVRPLLEARCRQGQMQLLVEDNSSPGCKVLVDLTGMEQILLNLVDNSCKYASEAEDRRVHLNVYEQKNQLILEVIDHGEGINEAELKEVTKAFYRCLSHRANTSGIGLGLALARRWVRQMGGDLEIHPGPGGRVKVRLPLAH